MVYIFFFIHLSTNLAALAKGNATKPTIFPNYLSSCCTSDGGVRSVELEEDLWCLKDAVR